MTRKPLSLEAIASLNDVMRKNCEEMERRKRPEDTKRGVLAELAQQPREA